MGAQKAAFQISVVAEIAALEKVEFGAGLLDLIKAFETVPHHILVNIAIEIGVPACHPSIVPRFVSAEAHDRDLARRDLARRDLARPPRNSSCFFFP